MSLHRRHFTVKALEAHRMQANECIAHSVSAANSRQTVVSNDSYCLIVCIVSNNPPFLSNWHLSTFIALHIRPFPSVRPLLSIPLHAIRRLQEWWRGVRRSRAIVGCMEASHDSSTRVA